jgi:hypothetical protein
LESLLKKVLKTIFFIKIFRGNLANSFKIELKRHKIIKTKKYSLNYSNYSTKKSIISKNKKGRAYKTNCLNQTSTHCSISSSRYNMTQKNWKITPTNNKLKSSIITPSPIKIKAK